MSGQDVGFFDVGSDCPDLVIEKGDLKADNGLETSALISLFSDRRVSIQELPEGETDQKGWWADLVAEPVGDKIGSRIWVLERIGKLDDPTITEYENILQEAFEWMVEDGLAGSVTVSAERVENNQIKGTVEIFKPNGENIPFKFVWDAQRLKILE